MGLDANGVRLLLWAKTRGATFDRTLTLGRQGFMCSPAELRRAFREFCVSASEAELAECFRHEPMGPLYADAFWRLLGARDPVSVDRSDFEGATLQHDLNEPFATSHHAAYDFVFDGGTLEHIFDYPGALRHCLELVRPGGHFLTIAPADNHLGHGFYQVSPELFFRVFDASNGYALRELVLFKAVDPHARFWRVRDPAQTGLRTELRSRDPLYLAALAQRAEVRPLFQSPPQQSDYVAAWNQARPADSGAAGGVLGSWRRKLNPYWPHWLRKMKDQWRYRLRQGPPKLSNRNHFEPVDPARRTP